LEGLAVKVTKTIRYLVRVRDYETVHVEVGAEADHHDLGYSDQEWAQMLTATRADNVDRLELLVITEVERLAHDELSRIAMWSEISPNLAEDFLSSTPTPPNRSSTYAGEQRTQKTDPPPASRRIRRSTTSGTPSPAA
jgi:hypothetical protein